MTMAQTHIERATTRVAAQLEIKMDSGGRTIAGSCIDLSAGGLGLRLESPPERGETVSLQLAMPNGRVIEAEAEVVHVGVTEPHRCGVRFRQLSPTSLFAIHAFVADSAPLLEQR
jgi:c-di-GMP-binding flagellar brake protein YcgR